MGSLYQFSGYVTNTGNTVLTNVFVYGLKYQRAVGGFH